MHLHLQDIIRVRGLCVNTGGWGMAISDYRINPWLGLTQ